MEYLKLSKTISYNVYQDISIIIDHNSGLEILLNKDAGEIIKQIALKKIEFDYEELKDFIDQLIELNILIDTKVNKLSNYESKSDQIESDGSIYDQLKEYCSNNLIPFQATLELTYRCSLKCKHCYLQDIKKDQNQELKTDQIFDFINQFRSLGGLFLTFTGGDPFIRDDFKDIFIYTRKKHIAVSILTTGLYIDDNWIELFKRYGVEHIQISLYGLNSEIHDYFTGKKGSFKKSFDTLLKLKANNLNVKVAISVTAINFESSIDLIKYLQKKDIDYNLNSYIFNTKGGKSFDKYQISNTQYKKLLKKSQLPNLGRLFNKESEDPICDAGRSIFNITPHGDLTPCIEFPEIIGNLKDRVNNLKNIWLNSQFLKKIRELKFKNFQDCYSCEYKNYCNRCYKYLKKDQILISKTEVNCFLAKRIFDNIDK